MTQPSLPPEGNQPAGNQNGVPDGSLAERLLKQQEATGAAQGDEGGLLSDAAKVFGADDNRKVEARQLDQLDKAEDAVEANYAKEHRTSASPVHGWVWDRKGAVDTEVFNQPEPSPEVKQAMEACISFVRDETEAGRLYGPDGKVSPAVEDGLAERGYYGALVAAEHGGWGASFSNFISMLQSMAEINPTIAGQGSIHGCIGAVDPVTHFGNAAQQAEHLPELASGQRISGFALTEPGAGSDLTNIQTQAIDKGDHYEIHGEKLFITNVKEGRKVGLVAKVDGKPEVLVVNLPDEEVVYRDGRYFKGDTELKEKPDFAFRDYELHALTHLYNRGLIFNGLKVPKEALLRGEDGELKPGSGLSIAYHGLNKGRVSLCANAAGTMTALLADMVPWTHERKTYNYEIADRELVQNRVGRFATRVVGATAMASWGAALLDEGYRGELECIVAKNFGATEMRVGAIDDCMVTHGGRVFLKGHPIGDYLHDLLAPSIYEGEKEMLSMAMFKSVVKEHAEQYLVPIQNTAKKLIDAGKFDKFDPAKNPAQFWHIKGHMLNYGVWMAVRNIETRFMSGPEGPPEMPKGLRKQFNTAMQGLRMMSLEVSSKLIKHQHNIQHRQNTIQELSDRTQKLVASAVTAMWGSQQRDPVDQLAAEMLCERLNLELSGKRPDERYFKRMSDLGKKILDGEYERLWHLKPTPVLMRYDESNRILNSDGSTSDGPAQRSTPADDSRQEH